MCIKLTSKYTFFGINTSSKKEGNVSKRQIDGCMKRERARDRDSQRERDHERERKKRDEKRKREKKEREIKRERAREMEIKTVIKIDGQ